MRNTKLKAVIDAEPLNTSRDDAERLAWLKESITVWSDITWSEFMRWATRYNGVIKMDYFKLNGATDLVKGACASGLIVLNAGQPLHLSIPEVRAFMAELVTDVFSEDEKDDLLAFSKTTQVRFESHGFPDIDDASWIKHLAEVRAL